MSTSFPAIAEFTNGEVSQVLEKAIQNLKYPTDQNETIDELQALNRGLILKAHQEAVEETIQSLKKKVIRSIAWFSVALVIADPILSVLVVGIRGLLRLYWDRDLCIHSHVPRRQIISFAFGGSISPLFLARILLQSFYFGSAIYYLCKERQTASDITIIAGCGVSLLLSAISRTSATSRFWLILATSSDRTWRSLSNFFRKLLNVICGWYSQLDECIARSISK